MLPLYLLFHYALSNLLFYLFFTPIIIQIKNKAIFHRVYCLLQAAPIKDVTIPDTAPNTLLMDKHISYIAAYGDKKDDYVSRLWVIRSVFIMLQRTSKRALY